MTTKQRAANLKLIAEGSVSIECKYSIPAELSTGQCIIESAWLAKAPANNCFGLKSPKGAAIYQTLATKELLTNAQIEAERKRGKNIISVGLLINGKRTVVIEERFQVFKSIEECFHAYARLLIAGRYFKTRFQRYLIHRNTERLLTDMSGADNQPPYFTGAGYVDLWRRITTQKNVIDAIAAARGDTIVS